jgi:hypothetical protein
VIVLQRGWIVDSLNLVNSHDRIPVMRFGHVIDPAVYLCLGFA